MTKEEVMQMIDEEAAEMNLSIEEAAIECLIMFYESAEFDEEMIMAEFDGMNKEQLLEACCQAYC